MLEWLPLPSQVTLASSTAGALVTAQVAQLGFEAKLLKDVTRLKTLEEERDD